LKNATSTTFLQQIQVGNCY